MSEIVPRYYQMNPETESVLFDGNDLEPGMVVLLENPARRVEVVEEALGNSMMADNYRKCLMKNRWCTVLRVKVIGGEVHFLAGYEDGTVMKRVEGLTAAWLVRIEPSE